MIEWTTEIRSIKGLKKHPKNPRQLTKEQHAHLKTSLEKFGLADKPIINVDGTIIGGHQRLKVLKELGHKDIEVLVPNRELTSDEVDEMNIRLNKNTGEWDFDVLANEWDVNDLVEWGFTEADLTGIMDAAESNEEGTEDESEQLEPVSDEDAKTKLGDVYELNGHRLVCGDSTNPLFVDLCLAGAKPILMVTDPPYGVNYDPNWRNEAGKGTRAIGKVSNDEIVDWKEAWKLFPGSIVYVWHAGKFCSKVQESLELCDFEVISQIIWVKQHFALSRGDYHWQHEPCWYMVKRGMPHNWQSARDQATTWDIANLNCFGKSKEDGEERTAHSTQKPIECMARPIRNNSSAGESIYDPFLGSGTTLIAAEIEHRICYGIELSPGYCDIIVDRWVKYMQKNNKEYVVKKNGEQVEI